MIIGITVSIAVLIGALAMYGSFLYGELKGYERGLDDSEQIIEEIYGEIRKYVD